MAERKLRCASCGKWFKATDYKHLICPACESLERAKRRLRVTAKPAVPLGARNGVVAPSGAANSTASPSPDHASTRPAKGMELVVDSKPLVDPAEATSHHDTMPAHINRPAKRGDAAFTSADQIAAIEKRYLELASPQEFDGIRQQVATELSLPKGTVKRVVRDLRARLGLPSWWEVQQRPLSVEQLAAVQDRYVPLLPLPPVGVHKQIASELGLSNLQVYRAIGQVRDQLRLPQYNLRPDAAALNGAGQETPAPLPAAAEG